MMIYEDMSEISQTLGFLFWSFTKRKKKKKKKKKKKRVLLMAFYILL